MDQEKVSSVLFRPTAFESTKRKLTATGSDLFNQLAPPDTGIRGPSASFGKQASARGTMLESLQHSFRYEDVQAFAEKVADDAGLRHAYINNPQLLSGLQSLSLITEKTAAQIRAGRLSRTVPTVVQVTEAGGGYTVKQANHRCFAPRTTVHTVHDVRDMLPKDAFEKLSSSGRVTITLGVGDTTPSRVEEASIVKVAGLYRVSSGGASVDGFVVPHVVDFHGKPLGYQMFMGDASHSMQEKVAGVYIGQATLPDIRPQGIGVFIYQDGPAAVAYEPVNVLQHVKVAGVVSYLCTRMSTGEALKVSVVPGLQKAAFVGDGQLAIPESLTFFPLRGDTSQKVSSTPHAATLQQQQKIASTSATLVSDGSCYQLRGEMAAAFSQEMLDDAQAEFALCSLGLTEKQASDAMRAARSSGTEMVPVVREVLLETSRSVQELTKAASARVDVESLRVDLTKELALLTSTRAEAMWKTASVIFAKDTSDAILSLGFVTPENASLYVNYLPELEKVAGKLAELLIASRLGMDDVRESSARNAMTQVNSVIRGLETLRDKIQ